MNTQICFICLGEAQEVRNMNHTIVGNIDGMKMPCCGQNGSEAPIVHISCVNQLCIRQKKIICPLCRIDLEPFLSGKRSFHELKKS